MDETDCFKFVLDHNMLLWSDNKTLYFVGSPIPSRTEVLPGLDRAKQKQEQTTSRNLSDSFGTKHAGARLAGWVAAGWLAGWLALWLAGWLAGWLAAGRPAGWLLAGCLLAAGWLLAGCLLAAGWLLAGCCLAALPGWLLRDSFGFHWPHLDPGPILGDSFKASWARTQWTHLTIQPYRSSLNHPTR